MKVPMQTHLRQKHKRCKQGTKSEFGKFGEDKEASLADLPMECPGILSELYIKPLYQHGKKALFKGEH
jgi:hypothetical protein